MSHTRTHVVTGFANPHLVCDICKRYVTGWHDNAACGCEDDWWNEPCECRRTSVTSACPSWSPVDGCTCYPPHSISTGNPNKEGHNDGPARDDS